MPSTPDNPPTMAHANPPTRLGRYQVIDRIAAGGMAEVFLAQSMGVMGFQRLVALKLIHDNFTQDPDFVKMFIDEARIAMHLHHRNIVQVFDLDEVDGTYFIAMEYVRGLNLYNLYERLAAHHRWIEVPMALYLAAEVCKGLHFAHTRTGLDGRPLGIIHRDISPQNILLSYEGEVKITDFGIATAAEKLHQTADGVVKGKYAYMAPERLNEATFDARVDVFSAGVLLYELLTGENPYARGTAVETIEAVLSDDIPPPSSRGALVPERLDAICLQALAKNPHDRWPTATAFADALTELAMELTYARKDMASGDAALAKLLAELCPTAQDPVVRSSPHAVRLPGIGVTSNTPASGSIESEAWRVQPTHIPVSPDATQPSITASGTDLLTHEVTRPTALPPNSWDQPPSRSHGNFVGDAQPDEPTLHQHDQPPLGPSRRVTTASSFLPLGAETDTEEPTVARDPRAPPPRHPRPISSQSIHPRPMELRDNAPLTSLPATQRYFRAFALISLGTLLFVIASVTMWSASKPAELTPLLLRIDSVPPGAEVYVHNQRLPSVTPMNTAIAVTPNEPVELTLLLAGYEPMVKNLSDQEQGTGRVFVELHAQKPSTGLRRLVTLRPKRGRWTHVYYNGKDQGPSPITLRLPVGVVELEVVKNKRRRTIRIQVPSSGPASIL